MRWSICILTFDSATQIERCLESIARTFHGESYEVLVHDNGSRDVTPELLRRRARRGDLPLRLYLGPRNEGTTVPRNRLARMASGEALLFLDADTEIVHLPPAELALRLGREPLTLLAPQLRLGDGSIQDSPRRLPTVLDKWRSAWRIASGQAVATSDRYPLPATEELEVETVMAACWVLSRQLFERVGGFDERIFYSPEDLDWCLRCWQAGGRILYLSQFEVRHYASKLSHRRTLSLTNLHHAAGLAYFFAKHRYALKRPTLTNVPSTSEPDR